MVPHVERHFASAAVVRDAVLGMADGLTVPFALAAGLTGAMVSTSIIVTAGLAEIVAGAISMGLGGYLAARTEREHYEAERRREWQETIDVPEREAEEVASVFRGYGLNDEHVATVVQAIRADPNRWVDFMMRFELGLEAPNPARARHSAWTIGGAYVVGGLIPLTPYMLWDERGLALGMSSLATLLALVGFGYVKGRLTGISPRRAAVHTVCIGSLAATAAFLIARLLQ
jgi:VIT1/CCC1 family predicted Fe2+/Mn2+ transporter